MIRGLADVPTEALRTLVRLVYKGEIDTPLDITQITRTGLQYCATDLLATLRTLDKQAVLAVLTVALAEREATARRSPTPRPAAPEGAS